VRSEREIRERLEALEEIYEHLDGRMRDGNPSNEMLRQFIYGEQVIRLEVINILRWVLGMNRYGCGADELSESA